MSGCFIEDGDEYETNDLYISWMKKMNKLPKLHPKSCSDKCGCFSKKNSHSINLINNNYENIIDFENVINLINNNKFNAIIY